MGEADPATALVPISRPGRLRPLFDAAGARWIELPVLHPVDPFLETAGEDIRRRMFVTEGPSGERLALRPDFTIPVCVAHLASGGGAERYAYEGMVFRRHDAGSKERLEAGYEDIGHADRVSADAGALSLAVAGVGFIAAGALSVRIGDIGLFAALLSALGLPGRWRRRLRRSFGAPALMAANLERLITPPDASDTRLDAGLRGVTRSNGMADLVALLETRAAGQGRTKGQGRSSAEIAERFLDQRAVPDPRLATRAADTIRAFLTVEAGLEDAAQRLQTFAADWNIDFGTSFDSFAERASALLALKLTATIRFEAGFGRPLDYYTGLVFDVRVPGQTDPIAGGGRYDRLMDMLGATAPIPAVGFTVRLDGPESGRTA